jgi:hypothetical protein
MADLEPLPTNGQCVDLLAVSGVEVRRSLDSALAIVGGSPKKLRGEIVGSEFTAVEINYEAARKGTVALTLVPRPSSLSSSNAPCN